ncbi:uncharacterized protein TRIVIDRAFT_221333 [Trichoderma virens Gv29-8]|uniref:Methyltransferase domain-containing protein n=1 Tax=Hypocrea virens (strain Gv29-8 / FGSC 10586) TaxID=413071 RepID=G9MQL9_HYPVG|nr:uncharacterized protein TRIVIDRAFT_221333 [Trichoderma virens Gv29-8]EHK24086.1 hypothetical protein TRIVIDRAFT_221333 [Trichoderma virens Gv29-8]UKZ50398.1 hypothetical protein TrVGV298_004658 [Trichoderma virens]
MAQYDDYGALYTKLKNRPIPIMQNRYASEAMNNLTGLRVLDAACGTGFYSQMMAGQGAAEVIGIDISSGMIENAKKELPIHWSNGPIRYFVGDFEQADLLQSLGLDELRGTFDVVFAAWLLNYAADWQGLSRMLDNIFDALKPGGKLIALTPNPFLLKEHGPEMTTEEGLIGDRWQVTEIYDYGYRVHMIVNTSPSVEFDSYVLYVSEYEKAAAAAGFPCLSWEVVSITANHCEKQTL